MKKQLLIAILSAATLFAQDPCVRCPNRKPANAAAAWKELIDGNDRYRRVDGKQPADRTDACRRSCTLARQNPFAIVLSCSDSRVPPEIVFDQRIGDIFVVRVAGNVASDEAVGSIEYAIAHLNKPDPPRILVVLGHEKCGAVETAMKLAPKYPPAHDMIPSILNRIFPAIRGQNLDPNKADDVTKAVRLNVDLTAEVLAAYSPVIRNAVTGGLRIQKAIYWLGSGEVTPRQ